MKSRTSSPVSRWIWIFLGAGAYSIHLFLGKNSQFMETLYSRGIFVVFRWIWDYTVGLIPLGLIYIFLVFFVIFLAFRLFTRIKRVKPALSFSRSGLLRGILFLLGAAGALIFVFYLFWGFNYNRLQIEKQLNLSPAALDLASLRGEALWAGKEAFRARTRIPDVEGRSLDLLSLPGSLEGILRTSHTSLLKRFGYPSPGRVRVRFFRPGSWMMRVNVSGIYIPYLGEGYIPSTALPVERPFDMAHEMAHALGFTGEDDCNFLALLACLEAGRPAIAYSGYLNYWLYVSRELRRASPLEYRELWDGLPEGMQKDILAISESWRRFQGPLRDMGRRVQDGYLKSQGIREGVLSYNRMVMLVAAWRAQSSSAKRP